MREPEPPSEQPEQGEQRGARRMVQTFFSLAGAELLTRAMLLVAAIIIARALAPNVFGQFTFAVALASIVGIVIDLGLTSLVTRDVSANADRASHLLGAFLKTQSLLAAGTFVFTSGLALAGAFGDAASETALVLAFATISVSSLSRPFEATLTGRGRAPFVFVSRSARGITLIAITILASLGHATPERFIAAMLISEAVGVAVVAFVCFTRSTRPRFAGGSSAVRRMLKLAVPFALLAGFNVLYLRIDILMLGWLDSDTAVGNYGIASRIMDTGIIIPAYFGGAFLATVAQTGARSALARMQTLSAARHVLILCLPVAFGLALGADQIVRLTAGSKYSSAGDILILLTPMIIWIGTYSVFANLQVALDQVPLLVKISVAGLLLKVALNAYAIPAHGSKGAAVTASIAEGAVVAIQLYFARAWYDSGPFFGFVARAAVCAAAMIAVGLTAATVVPWTLAFV
ncbi:MAG: oligosaccharide flippase family protein, partial [Dehalococcoidia bacterium]